MLRFLIVLFAFIWGCDNEKQPKYKGKLVADNTPFIVATMEFSPDTTEVFPEVFVATVVDTRDPYYHYSEQEESYEAQRSAHSPLMLSQAIRTLENTSFKPVLIQTAKVVLTGPLNDPLQKTIILPHFKEGFYRDKERKISMKAGASYELKVELPTGQKYQATTTFPKNFSFPMPDTLRIPTKVTNLGTRYIEEHQQFRWILGQRPASSTFGITGTAFEGSTFNQHSFACRLNRMSPFWCGTYYGVKTYPPSQMVDSTLVYWYQPMEDNIRNSKTLWHRKAYLSEELKKWYSIERDIVAFSSGDPFSTAYDLPAAVYARDKSFLPSVSNWYKLDANGNPLPKAESDAIGVFGAYTSRYKRMKVFPVRNYNLCDYNWKGCPNNP